MIRGSIPGRVGSALMAGLLCAALASPAPAQDLKLPPVDEAARNPAFAKYRAALIEAVRRRDLDYVVARAAPEIKLSFGGQFGRDAFRASLTGTQEWEGEVYWVELRRALELGGVFLDDGSFCTPYISCLEVPGCPDCDPFETVYVVSGDAVAHAAADPDSEIIARLSYDVLQMDSAKGFEGDFIPVRLPDGRPGFVTGPDFRFSIDYRARFEKITEGWRMTVFIAGD